MIIRLLIVVLKHLTESLLIYRLISPPVLFGRSALIPYLCCHRGLKHPDLTDLAQAVIVPLKNGLCSFRKLSEMILSVNVDMALPGCQTFDKIRGEIETMMKYLDEAEQLVRTKLEGLDDETENLTAEQSTLEKQRVTMKLWRQ